MSGTFFVCNLNRYDGISWSFTDMKNTGWFFSTVLCIFTVNHAGVEFSEDLL